MVKVGIATLRISKCSYKDAKSCLTNLLRINAHEFSGLTMDEGDSFVFIMFGDTFNRTHSMKMERLEIQKWSHDQIGKRTSMVFSITNNAIANSENARLKKAAKRPAFVLERDRFDILKDKVDI